MGQCHLLCARRLVLKFNDMDWKLTLHLQIHDQVRDLSFCLKRHHLANHQLVLYRGVDQKSVPAKPFGNVNNTIAKIPGYRAKFGLAVRYPGNIFILAIESTVESECEVLNDEISP